MIDKQVRARSLGHPSAVVWFTGLSGAGKSSIATELEVRLHELGIHTYLLEGDDLRAGLSRDLGFAAADRTENVRRAAEVAALMSRAGLVVLVALISPFRVDRQFARECVGADEFLEVFVDAPLEVAEQRDPKGLYARARRGELRDFTGIDSPYEAPLDPDLRLPTDVMSVDEAVAIVLRRLADTGVVR